jgi:hypothetical protein
MFNEQSGDDFFDGLFVFFEIVSNVVEVIFSYPPVSPLEMAAS